MYCPMPKYQRWCESWWHKVRYGSNKVESKQADFEITEYFCKKCGNKTGGSTTFGPITFKIPVDNGFYEYPNNSLTKPHDQHTEVNTGDG